MRGILVLAVLSIRSSYSREIEDAVEGDEIPDTLQWWFGHDSCWRVRTYALDHDIHAHKIGNSPQTTIELAETNNLKNYGDVIKVQHVVHFADCTDPSELKAAFGRIGLRPRIEIDSNGFAFWKPDDAMYWTKSVPG
jgi:hypothetical protein